MQKNELNQLNNLKMADIKTFDLSDKALKIGDVFTPLKWGEFAIDKFEIFSKWLNGATVFDPTMGEGNLLESLITYGLKKGFTIESLPTNRLFGNELNTVYFKRALEKFGKKYNLDMSENFSNEDFLRLTPRKYDIVFGNPPWLNFVDLPESYKEQIIERYQLKNIHEIWPNLSIYVHGGVSFTPYIKGFMRLLGKPLIYMETYLASEGFIAYQKRPYVDAMQISLDTGLFYEFVPFNSHNFDDDGHLKSNPETLTLNQIEEEKEYALLISSNAGAWRYLIGDTIKFTSKKHNEIRITGRTRHYLSLCGEHLSVDNMNRAVEMMCNKLNITVKEFTVSGIKHGSMFAHKWFLGTDDELDSEVAKELIDSNLKILNDDYRVERIEAIKNVFVEVLPTKIFYQWMREHGKEGAQNKFPRVIRGKQLEDWEDYIKNFPVKNE
jgi:hypothetical protein